MKFGYTIIYVKDVAQTIKFYQQAFGVEVLFMHESQQYAELATGNTKLAFAGEEFVASNGMEFTKNNSKQIPPGFEIGFISDDVEQNFQQAVKHGAVALKATETKPWGQTVAHVRDLNGIIVEICSEIVGD